MEGMPETFYILDAQGQPIQVSDWLAWLSWYADSFGTGQRVLGKDQIGEIEVSTVFLGTGYGQPPQLWETMIFGGGEFDGAKTRYTTRAEALAGHARAVDLVRGHLCRN